MSTLTVSTIQSSGGGGVNILKGFNRRPPLHRGPLFTKTAAWGFTSREQIEAALG